MAKLKAKLTPEQKKQRNEIRKQQTAPPPNAMHMRPYSERNLDRPAVKIFDDYMKPYHKISIDKTMYENMVGMTLMVWNTVSANPSGTKKDYYKHIEELSNTKIGFFQRFLLSSMIKRRKKKFGQYDFYIAEPKIKGKDGDFSVSFTPSKPA